MRRFAPTSERLLYTLSPDLIGRFPPSAFLRESYQCLVGKKGCRIGLAATSEVGTSAISDRPENATARAERSPYCLRIMSLVLSSLFRWWRPTT